MLETAAVIHFPTNVRRRSRACRLELDRLQPPCFNLLTLGMTRHYGHAGVFRLQPLVRNPQKLLCRYLEYPLAKPLALFCIAAEQLVMEGVARFTGR